MYLPAEQLSAYEKGLSSIELVGWLVSPSFSRIVLQHFLNFCHYPTNIRATKPN